MLSSSTRILIVGHRGMLAQALARALDARNLPYTGVDRDTFDITDRAQVDGVFDHVKPGLVLNCAAFTHVDGCETDPETADAVNGHAVGFLAEAARRQGARLVHYSTDFVFDGSATAPYPPDATPNPLSAYGRSKLLGETNLKRIDPPNWLMLRTAWLYGEDGNCFPRTILNAARAGKPLCVVGDQVGSPTWTGDLAATTLELIDAGAAGIYHAVNSGATTWHDFTRAILDEFEVPAALSSQTSAQWAQSKPGAAHRPAYSVLDTSATAAAIGHPLRPWREALRDYRRAVQGRA